VILAIKLYIFIISFKQSIKIVFHNVREYLAINVFRGTDEMRVNTTGVLLANCFLLYSIQVQLRK